MFFSIILIRILFVANTVFVIGYVFGNFSKTKTLATISKVAAILSIVESCRRLRVPVKEYLLDILPGMDRRKLSEIGQLTPSCWSAARD